MDLQENKLEDQLQGHRANPPFYLVLVFLIIAVIFSSLIGTLLISLYAEVSGTDLEAAFRDLSPESSAADRHLVRMINFISHFMTFTVPAIAVAVFLYRRHWPAALGLHKRPTLFNLLWGSFFILASFPFAQLAYWVNRQLPFPSWVQGLEKTAEGLVNNLLIMDGPGELLFNLLLVAVLPAIGEELVFRGIIQQKLEERFRSGLLAVWVTAFFFSVIHLQFEGLFPRMILGAVLGYLFYWTRNLWVPIIAHFMINAVQVLGKYFFSEQFQRLESESLDAPNWGAGLFSLVMLLVLGRLLWKHNQKIPAPETEP